MDGIRSIAATIRTTQLLSRPRKSLPQGKDPAGSGDPNTVGADDDQGATPRHDLENTGLTREKQNE